MTTIAPHPADWRDRAACAGEDTELWFGQPHQTQPALATCAGCPVRAECLHDALKHETPHHRYGIWGGLTGAERARLPELPTATADAVAALRERLADTGPETHTPAERTDPPKSTNTVAAPADAVAVLRERLADTRPETHTPAERTNPPMSTNTAAAPADADLATTSRLLRWAEDHPDPDVQAQGARAEAALTGLRKRYTADRELAKITSERERLEKQLAKLQAREAELAPAKPKKRRAYVRDYDTREVRARRRGRAWGRLAVAGRMTTRTATPERGRGGRRAHHTTPPGATP